MSNVLTYIQNNSLPCITWIDATDSSMLTVSGNTFTAKNKINNIAYDFIQTNPALHPIISTNGLSFTDNKRLFPRQADIFSPVLQQSSYSMIFITKGNPAINQQLLAIAKNNPLLPKFLDIQQDSGGSKHSFANVNLQSFLEFEPFVGSTQTLMFSHDIRLGRTDVSVNKAPFTSYVNTNKGYILNNFPSSFYIGNSQSTLPFIGELLHFLIFIPAIDSTDLLNLGNLLSNSKPVLDKISEEFVNYQGAYIDLTTTTDVQSYISYAVPYVITQSYKYAFIDLTTEVSLSFYYKWNEMTTENWNLLSEEFWNNIE